MKKISPSMIIQEIGGIRPADAPFGERKTHKYNRNADIEYNADGSEKQLPKYQTFKPKMDGWQLELYNHILRRPRQNIFVNAMPAAGKTWPIVAAWQETEKLNRPTGARLASADRILWVTPTVQLADQIYHNDLWPTLVKIELSNTVGTLTAELFNTKRERIEQKTCLRTGVAKIGPSPSLDTNFVVCTYPFAPYAIEHQNPDIVVIDETQEYVPIDEHEAQFVKDKASSFVQILKNTSKQSSIILLTGSMHKETTEAIVSFLYTQFHRQFITVNAPTARNRAYIQVIPFERMGTSNDIQNLVMNHIRQESRGNAIILFSVRNHEESVRAKRSIIPIAETLVRRLPMRSIEKVVGVSPNNNFDSKSYHTNPNSPYSKDTISTHDAQQYMTQDREDPQYIANWLGRMLKAPPHGTVHNSPGKQKPNDIPDPLLAKCILCGFAYLAGGGQRDRRLMSEEIGIVQTLFKLGKIYSLLATDMIGVGTTLTIQNLYIPTLTKMMTTGKFGEVNDSSLVQLIHRVGRLPSASGTVYCNPKDFTRIVHFLNENPEETVTPAFFGGGKSSIEQEHKKMKIRDTVHMFLSLAAK